MRGVAHRFAGRPPVDALGPIDLTVDDGEIVALLGPSGCGKTTLLRVVADLLSPTAGDVQRSGESVGVVFQDANLLPWMSVVENVALPLRLAGVARDERLARAAELCQLVGIAGFEHRWPRELSTGMRQRAATGRALCGDPDVLLLDEPFASLDALARDQLNLELQRILMARPRATVLVTHSIPEAVFIADRVLSLSTRPGRITSETAVTFARPRSIDLLSAPAFQDVVRELRRLMGPVT